MDERTDIELMLRVREDDEAAFETLHERFQGRVLGFFWGLTRNADATNELAQETFLRVWQVRRRYQASGPFAAYLFGVARMVLLEKRRKAARRARLCLRLEATAEDRGEAKVHGPDAFAHAAEMEEALADAVGRLPEEQRMAFLLHTVQGMPMDQVAAALDCPVNTARSRRILAVRKLRHILSPVAASLGFGLAASATVEE